MSKSKTKKKKPTTAPCIFCGGPNSLERVDIGRFHCTHDDCVGRWQRDRLESEGLVLVLMHKQGLAWVKRDEVPANSMRRDGGSR